jgi:hypothetical protein
MIIFIQNLTTPFGFAKLLSYIYFFLKFQITKKTLIEITILKAYECKMLYIYMNFKITIVDNMVRLTHKI